MYYVMHTLSAKTQRQESYRLPTVTSSGSVVLNIKDAKAILPKARTHACTYVVQSIVCVYRVTIFIKRKCCTPISFTCNSKDVLMRYDNISPVSLVALASRHKVFQPFVRLFENGTYCFIQVKL